MIHNTEYRESKGPGSAPKRPRSVLESLAALVPKQRRRMQIRGWCNFVIRIQCGRIG